MVLVTGPVLTETVLPEKPPGIDYHAIVPVDCAKYRFGRIVDELLNVPVVGAEQ